MDPRRRRRPNDGDRGLCLTETNLVIKVGGDSDGRVWVDLKEKLMTFFVYDADVVSDAKCRKRHKIT